MDDELKNKIIEAKNYIEEDQPFEDILNNLDIRNIILFITDLIEEERL